MQAYIVSVCFKPFHNDTEIPPVTFNTPLKSAMRFYPENGLLRAVGILERMNAAQKESCASLSLSLVVGYKAQAA